MTTLEWFELASYVVTIVGLPFAIAIFVLEQRKGRQNEEEEIFQRLSDEYREFLKLVLENADLHLLRKQARHLGLTDEQEERRLAIFGILISLFERAYLLVYEKNMEHQTQRLWKSWEDYMTEWVRHDDFRKALPTLLEGEDEEFSRHIRSLARREDAGATGHRPAAPDPIDGENETESPATPGQRKRSSWTSRKRLRRDEGRPQSEHRLG
jgi:hypothetical protein